MVYRGKPSAGCEICRKAKKRCGLEQPACLRCVKLKKTCSGYRDTTSLQIQDETSSVRKKAERRQAQSQWQQSSMKSEMGTGLPSPETTNSDSSTSTPSDAPSEMDLSDAEEDSLLVPSTTTYGPMDMSFASLIMMPIKPKPDDVATTYFYNQFTSNNHWQFLRGFSPARLDPCLELAIKACGMAAFDNVANVTMGREYSRSMYAEALGLLNKHLRDPKLCKTDASLIAVSMLGYYENLTCDSRASIQSWKAHIAGATQLLKLRGTAQFNTQVGRIMYREIRAQITIQSLWDDVRPPSFLWEFQPALEAYRTEEDIAIPVDELTTVILDFAVLRAKMKTREIPDTLAAQEASELESRFLQWQIDTSTQDDRWRYYEMEVPDSENIWDGKVHSYNSHPAPTAWNTYRSIRIMLSRTQEWLCRRLQFSDSEREEQMQYFRKVRRQMTDDICATIPVQLGNASPAYSSPCVLVTAYGSIWPLFFAGTCAFERVRTSASTLSGGRPQLDRSSAAAAQAMWLLSRLDYVSENVGLKWADGVAATLRGDFHIYDNLNDDESDTTTPFAKESEPWKEPWTKAVERAGRGPRLLIEKPSPLSDALAKQSAAQRREKGPIWLGAAVKRDDQFKLTKIRPSEFHPELLS